MATIHQTLRIIKTRHYQNLKPHEKHFINDVLDGLDGLGGEVPDNEVGDYLTASQEKFIFFIGRRFNIFVSKILFKLKQEKPDLPFKIIKHEIPSPPHPPIELKIQISQAAVNTGLGPCFDDIAAINQYANYRPRPPYDLKFQNRPIITIYGIDNRAGWAMGQAFLEMIASYSQNLQERDIVSTFLSAMHRMELHEEVKPKPLDRGKGQRIKGIVSRPAMRPRYEIQ